MNSIPYYFQIFASILFIAFAVFNAVRSLLNAQFFLVFMFSLILYISFKLYKLSVEELKQYKKGEIE